MVELRSRHRGNSRSLDDLSIDTNNNNIKQKHNNNKHSNTDDKSDKSKLQPQRKHNRFDSIITWQLLAILFLIVSLTGFSLNVAVEFIIHDISDFDAILMISFALLFVISSVPLTYIIIGYKYNSSWSMFQPLQGGIHFVILQASAWTIYGIVLILIIWVAITGAKKIASGILATIGTAGVIAQLLILMSLQYFISSSNDSTIDTKQVMNDNKLNDIINQQIIQQPSSAPLNAAKTRRHSTSATSIAKALEQYKHKETVKPLTTVHKIFDYVPIVVSVVSVILAIIVESLDLTRSATVSLRTTSLCGLLVSVPLTNLLVAHKQTHTTLQNKTLYNYTLLEPLQGGVKFISLQALGWLLWITAVLLSIFSVYANVNNINITGMFTLSSVGNIVSQCVVLLSLQYFDISQTDTKLDINKTPQLTTVIQKQLQQQTNLTGQQAKETAITLISQAAAQTERVSLIKRINQLRASITKDNILEKLRDIRSLLIITAFFLSPLISLTMILSPFALSFTLYQLRVPLLYSILPSSVLVICYGLTYHSNAPRTGSRLWPGFRYNDVIWNDFARYFNASVISDGEFDNTQQYIFGFSPHGIYPMSAVWCTLFSDWFKHYDIDVNVAGASVMFYVPIIRELVMWAGGIEVSRSSVKTSLQQGKNILLIPGGQREMRYSRSSNKHVVCVNRHTGFIRLAIEHNCSLVPIFSFGEHDIINNIYLPDIQHKATKYLGYLFPMWPYGRWFSPLPNPVKLTFVVGQPIHVQHDTKPTKQQIDNIHKQYYEQLNDLFYKYRDQAGYPNLELQLKDH